MKLARMIGRRRTHTQEYGDGFEAGVHSVIGVQLNTYRDKRHTVSSRSRLRPRASYVRCDRAGLSAGDTVRPCVRARAVPGSVQLKRFPRSSSHSPHNRD